MRVAVIGAGVAGLTAAYRLSADGLVCDVYERWPGLGGQAATLDVGDGVLLERYYHHFFTSDAHIAELHSELGLEIDWLPSSVAMFAEGRSRPFTTPLDLLRYRPLPLRSRVRMGLAVVKLKRRHSSHEPFENMTAREWIEREMGQPVWEKVWGPLLRGKFGRHADELSMAWLWSKLSLRRQIKGREARTEVLGYPREGFEVLHRALRGRIEGRGGRVMIDRPAARVDRGDDGGLLVTPGASDSFRRGHDPRKFEPAGDPERYDAVLATVPSEIFEQLLSPELQAEVGDNYLGRVHGAEYQAALCLLLELDREFSPFYWTNVADPEVPFIGVIEQTNFVSPDRYGGRRFLYVANYVEQDDELLSLSDDELLERYEPGLRRINPGFSRSWVRRAWLFREPHAQPVVTAGYGSRIPALATPARGLFLSNITQIYPEDRGTNYSVRLGGEAATEVAASADVVAICGRR